MPGGFERLADLETAPTPKIPPDGFAMGVTPTMAPGELELDDRRESWECADSDRRD